VDKFYENYIESPLGT